MQAPNICPGYQTGTINISIYDSDNNDNLVHRFGLTEYTQQNLDEPKLIIEELRSELIQGRHYKVEVTVESIGMLRFKQKSFCKLRIIINY